MTPSTSVRSPDGVTICYDSHGSGSTTLVFVHGWACNRSHWRNQVAALSDRYRTIAIDLGGHGESGTGRTEWSRAAFAGDVVAVLGQEEVDRAVLIGHSMGGGVILKATQTLGKRVVGLVGADTFMNMHVDPKRSAFVGRIRMMEEDYLPAAAAWIGGMFSVGSPAELRDRVAHGMLSTPRKSGMGALMAMLNGGSVIGMAGDIGVPWVTINSRNSPINVEESKKLGLEVKRVTTSGHFVMVEDPETFNLRLDDALETMR